MPEPKSNIRFSPVENPFYVHPLDEPIFYGDNQIGEVAIRKPTGRDLLHIGNPVIADPTSGKEARIDVEVAFQMTAALSGIPEKILEKIDPAELVDLFWKVGSLFIPGWQHVLPAMMTLKAQSSALQEQPAS